eukprot:gnl/MRDRNA2_/MRDRNA2_203032_c0_seq1.p1 gnl/MRDRNA2_/MRDRNA2_203032_c0~~gnl/MRDRNA2_/MRDRNA2_203032_c0_seq1.p1  ORF type:complete len:264 (-),score=33.65 gnl/MRDRNA2_/MRDRNA2_203032_c0_seq1:150-941(-)
MSRELTEAQNMAVGCTGAFTCTCVMMPIVYCKNAAQQGLPFTMNPRILYRGMASCLVNETGQMGFHFCVAGFLKKMFGTSLSGEMASALLAGAFISPYVQCCELTMIQQQRFGGSLWQTPQRIVREFGVRGLFRGYTAILCREMMWTSFFLGTTPLTRKWLIEEKGWNVNAAATASYATNGTVVGILSCPFDGLSTAMKGDLERKNYSGFFSAFRKRVAGGPKVFFGGVLWRSINVMGAVFIANPVRFTLEPLVIDYNSRVNG